MTDKIVFLGDPQEYSASAIPAVQDLFGAQTQWCVDTTDVVFVSLLGDIVNAGDTAAEWVIAGDAVDLLDARSSLAYGICNGNHDEDNDDGGGSGSPNGSYNTFRSYFGHARYNGETWYGGTDHVTTGLNFYQKFDVDGVEHLHLTLEFKAVSSSNSDAATVIAWIESILDANPNTPTIISTHYGRYSYNKRSTFGDDLWDLIVKTNSQIFLVVNGHYGGNCHRTLYNDAGLMVHEVTNDFQDWPDGGGGWLQYMEKTGARTLNVYTYNPSTDESLTDSNQQYSLPDPNQPPIVYDYRFKSVSGKEPPISENDAGWNSVDVAVPDGDAVMTVADFVNFINRKSGCAIYVCLEGGDQGAETTPTILHAASGNASWTMDILVTPGTPNTHTVRVTQVDDTGTTIGSLSIDVPVDADEMPKTRICFVSYGESGGAKLFLDGTEVVDTDLTFHTGDDVTLDYADVYLFAKDESATDPFVGSCAVIKAANVAHQVSRVSTEIDLLTADYF